MTRANTSRRRPSRCCRSSLFCFYPTSYCGEGSCMRRNPEKMSSGSLRSSETAKNAHVKEPQDPHHAHDPQDPPSNTNPDAMDQKTEEIHEAVIVTYGTFHPATSPPKPDGTFAVKTTEHLSNKPAEIKGTPPSTANKGAGPTTTTPVPPRTRRRKLALALSQNNTPAQVRARKGKGHLRQGSFRSPHGEDYVLHDDKDREDHEQAFRAAQMPSPAPSPAPKGEEWEEEAQEGSFIEALAEEDEKWLKRGEEQRSPYGNLFNFNTPGQSRNHSRNNSQTEVLTNSLASMLSAALNRESGMDVSPPSGRTGKLKSHIYSPDPVGFGGLQKQGREAVAVPSMSSIAPDRIVSSASSLNSFQSHSPPRSPPRSVRNPLAHEAPVAS